MPEALESLKYRERRKDISGAAAKRGGGRPDWNSLFEALPVGLYVCDLEGYLTHYNRHAAEIWWKHRQVLRAVTQRFPYTLARRTQVIREHRELIEMVKAGEADKAADCVARHVEGSGRHILEQMRAYNAARAG